MARAMASPLRVKNTAYFDIAATPSPPTRPWDSCVARWLKAMRPGLDRQASRARCWLPRSGSEVLDGPGRRTRVTQRVSGLHGRRWQGEPHMESLQERQTVDPLRGGYPSRVGGYWFPMAADPDFSRLDLLMLVEQARAQSRLLSEQVAELAEAVAEVELEVARVHEGMAAQGGSLAAQAAEHARRARDFAAREQAEAERLRRVGAGWGSSP